MKEMKQLIPDNVTITHNGEEVTFCLQDIINQNNSTIPALEDIYSIAMLKIAEELTPGVVKVLSEQLNKTLDDRNLLDYPQVHKLELVMDTIDYKDLLKLQRKFADKVGKCEDSREDRLTKLMAEMVDLTIKRRYTLQTIQLIKEKPQQLAPIITQDHAQELMTRLVYLIIRRRHVLHLIQCESQEKNITEEIK